MDWRVSMSGMTESTRDDAARLLMRLRTARTPLTAVELAGILALPGLRETKRRHVRAIVKSLRDSGEKIVATLDGGYWLTDDPATWKEYLEGRKIDAKRVIGESHRRQQMATDAAGQGLLFVRR